MMVLKIRRYELLQVRLANVIAMLCSPSPDPADVEVGAALLADVERLLATPLPNAQSLGALAGELRSALSRAR